MDLIAIRINSLPHIVGLHVHVVGVVAVVIVVAVVAVEANQIINSGLKIAIKENLIFLIILIGLQII